MVCLYSSSPEMATTAVGGYEILQNINIPSSAVRCGYVPHPFDRHSKLDYVVYPRQNRLGAENDGAGTIS